MKSCAPAKKLLGAVALAIGLLGFSPNLLATDDFVICLMQELDYYDYFREGGCAGNVCALLAEAQRDSPGKMDLTQAKVVYAWGDTGRVHGYETRGGEAEEWAFHVFMEYKGLVYDLDYKDWEHGTPTRAYLNSMFVPSGGGVGAPSPSLHFTSIPVTDYLVEYGHVSASGKHIDHRYYLSSPEARSRYASRGLHDAIENGLPKLPEHVLPMPDLAVLDSPRIVVMQGPSGKAQIAQWRDGSYTVELRASTGKIYVVQGEKLVDDPARVAIFLAAARSVAAHNPSLKVLLDHYDQQVRR